MRNFRFRLDPLARIKRYQIERVEEEISRLEAEIQQRLREIDEGRKALQERRNQLVETIEDPELLQAERSFDLFRAYTFQVERQKEKEIAERRKQQENKRQELIQLYQEEKILERLREKRYQEWEAQNRRQEGYLMDEIGAQKYIRRQKEHGGALLYLLIPLLLIGAAVIVGFMTGALDKQILERIPYLKHEEVKSPTPPAAIPSPTPEMQQYYTLEQLLGDPDMPMPEALRNLAKERERLRQKEQELNERERLIAEREKTLSIQEARVSEFIKQSSAQIAVLKNLETLRTDRDKSELAQREQKLVQALSGKKPKETAEILTSLFKSTNTTDPNEIRENKMIVLRLLHRYQGKNLQDLFTIIGKTDKQTAAEITKAYLQTNTDELYGLGPTPIPGTAAVSAATFELPTLPPPIPVVNGTPQPGAR